MLNKNNKIAALIVAAGSGERFGGDVPKQYAFLMGKPVLAWSIDAFKNHPLISEVAIVIHPDHADHFKNAAKDMAPIFGGGSRQESVQKGLQALRAGQPDFVLIHDAARPLVSESMITALCHEVMESGAVIPGIAVTDTVKRNGKTESREGLCTVQTPQAFNFELIDGLHLKYQGKSYTDDAALCEADNQAVKIIPGQRDNIKITHPEDISLAEQYLFSQYGDVRTGQGYDVHRLVAPSLAGQKLMLCGVSIPHDKVLEGHSDADVGLHAITDAILGTICDGDIGQHFSPKDSRWKNADSATFLKHAAELVMSRGGVIAHVDVTLVCEAPKIAPHRGSMRQRIAEILQLPLNRVSVKATTTEGLGFTGRGEGIAAQSIVTVRLPFRSGQ
ncbi:MAG: bifunctional 2-C-methyl-D-erythritol 4-phosphate cytidylyltransferase/2-C-methyl-D-erythritol 2,4-cyclodiphosphate synthase [Alphaproteobacteria bacterium]|nr:bifunctional 2-C-methyl-D-erythritol 4-phosphate cytidylyltransferase/2-C-methyl-D-erythritol 2,4-cyclodiphosphate synthase [Alphaproteobacteria bacterium]